MIKVGCAGAHPEDVSFLLSGEVVELFRSKNFVIEPSTVQPDEPSVDVLFVAANKMNKLASVINLRSRTWILLSSNKADAWRAWQLGAAYFLLRPYSLEDVQQALERAEQCYYWKKQRTPSHFQNQQLEFQLTKGRKISVRFADILFLEAQGEVTCVYLNLPGQEKITTTRNLGYWERQLEGGSFIRIHKKYLANVAHVSALQADSISVQGFAISVAKRRRKEVERAFYAHQMQDEAAQKHTLSSTGQFPFMKKK
jgi:DNA-binding LytR/AlgR family response regulator